MTTRLHLRRRRGPLLAAAALTIVVIAVVIVAASGGSSHNAAADSPVTSAATTRIVRQDLVEHDDEDGTLGYTDTRAVVNHLSGYITWLPSAGTIVRPDHALYKVNGSPVILLSGSQPAYRTLDASTKGRDVRQLEHDLRDLGYDRGHAMTVDGVWTSATTAAVERWQKAHGLSQTGSIELGRIVFQPGVRRVASVDTTLGGAATSAGAATGSGLSGGGSTQGASYSGSGAGTTRVASYTPSRARSARTVFASNITTTTQTTTTTAPTTTTTTPTPTTTTPTTTTTTPTATAPTTTTPKRRDKTKTRPGSGPITAQSRPSSTAAGGSAPAVRGATARAASVTPSAAAGAGSGSSAANSPSNTIMTTTSTRSVVTVALDTTKSELAKPGASVSVQMPSGRTVAGRIAAVGKVATKKSSSSNASSSSSSTATINVSIRLLHKSTALDQAPVTVSFEQSRVKDVLTIPVTALIARPGGHFAVEVVEGTSRRMVSVAPGVYTSGSVEITGPGLQSGMRVTNAAVQ